jgi:anti-sigma regulatory factor (Ser/Thr protein kinase)
MAEPEKPFLAVLGPEAGDDRSMALFDRRVESAGEARSWLSDFLGRRSVGARAREDATLIVSELVSNAIRYGAGSTVLRAAVTDRTVQVSVTDSGDALPELLPLDNRRVGGLGLRFVDEVASGWGVAPFPGGKTVWATVAL